MKRKIYFIFAIRNEALTNDHRIVTRDLLHVNTRQYCMLEKLKEDVLQANLDLVRNGLVIYTWGNVSGIDRDRGLVAIKPSGIPYDLLHVEDIVLVDLNGNVVEGTRRPSSDTPTHLVLYRQFPEIGGVVHTHSTFAVAWAQAGKDIPCLGTTHADHFYGSVPCTEDMSPEAIHGGYESGTGEVIVNRFRELDPMSSPGVLVKSHGPFTWGRTPSEAVCNSKVLEEVAKMAWLTTMLNPEARIREELIEKHYLRKHGPGATYGQP